MVTMHRPIRQTLLIRAPIKVGQLLIQRLIPHWATDVCIDPQFEQHGPHPSMGDLPRRYPVPIPL